MNKTSKKIFFGMIFLLFNLFLISFGAAQVLPCVGTDSYLRLSYSPSDLNYGEFFNVTYTDMNNFGGTIGRTVWLNENYSNLWLISNENQNVVNIGGSGKAVWLLNSSAGGNYTVNAIVSLNDSYNCSLAKIISIAGLSTPETIPNVTVNMADWTTINASKNYANYPIIYQNIGTGNAKNISTLFSYPIWNDTFSYYQYIQTLTPTEIKQLNYSVNASLCGLSVVHATTNYYNEIGENGSTIDFYDEFNVSGSDLQITNVYVPQTSYYNGQTINAIVSITNNNRTLNGIIPAAASNVTVYFDDYTCSSIGSLAINGVQNFSCSYRISETFSSTRTVNYVVRVEANNDCMNYASLSNYKTQNVAITVRISSTGGGGSGGDDDGSTGGSTYVAVCGNKICEIGENIANCPTDCGQTTVTPNIPGQTSNDLGLYVYSDDGKTFVYLQSGTKTFMEKMPVLNPREWIIVEKGNITTKLPYGVSMIRQYEFIPNGLEFIPDATISFKYNSLELKNGVYLMYFNPEEQKWVFINAVVDSNNNLISSKVGHFSTYALVTKENYPILTGFVLIDSMIGFVSQNLLWDMFILVAIILVILVVIYYLNREDNKKKKK